MLPHHDIEIALDNMNEMGYNEKSLRYGEVAQSVAIIKSAKLIASNEFVKRGIKQGDK